jgi:hypothetical protein
VSDLALWAEAGQWVLLLGVVAVLLGVVYLLASLQRRLGPEAGVLIPSDGLPLGEPAPKLAATDRRTGRPVGLAALRGRAAVVVFLSPSCKACIDLVPALNRLAGSRSEPVVVVAADGGGARYTEVLTRRIRLVDDPDRVLERAWAVRWTPMVYLVDGAGTIAMRSVSNTLLDLEDTLDGIGYEQGGHAWVPEEGVAG